MTRCSRAAFGDRNAAVQAKRQLLRQYRDSPRKALTLSVAYCDECDKYHVLADKTRYPFNDQQVRILECLAQGYRDAETAKILEMSTETVQWRISMMLKRFNALSRPNLIAITIALGLVDPNDFVPHDEEQQHA